MNHRTAVLLREAEGDTVTRKRKRKNRAKNTILCPELDFIGHHLNEDDKCRYCDVPMVGLRAKDS